jgi:hypothetical protein
MSIVLNKKTVLVILLVLGLMALTMTFATLRVYNAGFDAGYLESCSEGLAAKGTELRRLGIEGNPFCGPPVR